MDNKKDISLLPEEMRKKEERFIKRDEEEREEIKLHIPQKQPKEKWVKPLNKEKEGVSRREKFFQGVFGNQEERKKRKLEKERRSIEKLKKKQEEHDRKKREKEEEKRKKQEKLLEKNKFKEEGRKISSLKEKKKEEKMKEPVLNQQEKKDYNEQNKFIPSPQQQPQKEKEIKIVHGEHKAGEVETGMTVSLIPEEFINPPALRFKRSLMMFIFSVLLAILIMGAAYLWMVWQESKVASQTFNIDDRIISLDKEIASYETTKKDAQELQERIKLVGDLLDKHVYWTKFFDFLEKNTVEGVYYVAIAAVREGSIALSAVADNYSSIARQLVAFETADDLVVKAVVNSAVAQISEKETIIGINFNIDLDLRENIFIK